MVAMARLVDRPTELYADDKLIHETLERNATVTPGMRALQGVPNDAEQYRLWVEMGGLGTKKQSCLT